MTPSIPELSPEQKEIIREISRTDYQMFKDDADARLRFQIEFAQSLLRGLTLINGGAIVALFTFIGSTSAKFDSSDIWGSFVAFSAGLTCVMFAYVGAFFSQKYFMEADLYQAWNAQLQLLGGKPTYDVLKPMKDGNVAFIAGIASAFAGLLCFIAGASMALAGVL